MEIKEKRKTHGYEEPETEVHGKVIGFQPAGDYVLVRRLKSIEENGGIIRPDVAVELAERGEVIARSFNAMDKGIPIGVVIKFSKYGAEDINFDDAGNDRYALVRAMDIRGWHNA
jgi:co-chaperonin GroES (HSP10)